MDSHPVPSDQGTAATDEEGYAAAITHQRRINLPLVFVGLRCIARYVALPFVLPLMATAFVGAQRGIASGTVLAVLLALDLAGVTSIVLAVRGMYRDRHPHRRKYLLAGIVLTAVVVLFFINDVRITVFGHPDDTAGGRHPARGARGVHLGRG